MTVVLPPPTAPAPPVPATLTVPTCDQCGSAMSPRHAPAPTRCYWCANGITPEQVVIRKWTWTDRTAGGVR